MEQASRLHDTEPVGSANLLLSHKVVIAQDARASGVVRSNTLECPHRIVGMLSVVKSSNMSGVAKPARVLARWFIS
jgi:hypothetical protein